MPTSQKHGIEPALSLSGRFSFTDISISRVRDNAIRIYMITEIHGITYEPTQSESSNKDLISKTLASSRKLRAKLRSASGDSSGM